MKEIKKYLESRIGKYSFFFEDLKSGYVYGYNENVSMTAAGCMKLPIAVSLIKAVEDKKVDFMDKIKIQTSDKVYGTGIIHEFNEREYTVFELMVIMLIQSDNTAANKIIDIVGMEQINEDIIAMGLKNTRLNRKTNDERTAIEDIENITTAYDLSRIWKHLANGTFLSKDNGQMLIDILRRQQIKNKLALYIPDDLKIEISSKTGDKKGVENDTAYLELPKGKFVFTILSQEIPNSVYGTISLAKCGKMMWDGVMNNWN
ncbi:MULTISPECIES: serine hydrolase [unclassified Clostridium]|jgi:beta-lactamase class A|uniref:serine hydrolase n=1 Tax=Clostridium TaxID=1485 RepID=UPI001C8CE27B|nr:MULTISPECIES: serine hydrolase [unclassified Clostridium]MBX9136750.1 serine hydrolase [Clostridium sp. K12(2020)]MBX9145175.1 serine hydrolase [Clostridium sp. K13]MDU2290559.1 serine hydrolase [Clostridium celatum]